MQTCSFPHQFSCCLQDDIPNLLGSLCPTSLLLRESLTPFNLLFTYSFTNIIITEFTRSQTTVSRCRVRQALPPQTVTLSTHLHLWAVQPKSSLSRSAWRHFFYQTIFKVTWQHSVKFINQFTLLENNHVKLIPMFQNPPTAFRWSDSSGNISERLFHPKKGPITTWQEQLPQAKNFSSLHLEGFNSVFGKARLQKQRSSLPPFIKDSVLSGSCSFFSPSEDTRHLYSTFITACFVI